MKRAREEDEDSEKSSKIHLVDSNKLGLLYEDHRSVALSEPVNEHEGEDERVLEEMEDGGGKKTLKGLNFAALRANNIYNKKLEQKQFKEKDSSNICLACKYGFFTGDAMSGSNKEFSMSSSLGKNYNSLAMVLKQTTLSVPSNRLLQILKSVYNENIRFPYRESTGRDLGEWEVEDIENHLDNHMIDPGWFTRRTLDELREMKDTAKSHSLQVDLNTGIKSMNRHNVDSYLKIIQQMQRIYGFKPEKAVGFKENITIASTSHKNDMVKNHSKKKS